MRNATSRASAASSNGTVASLTRTRHPALSVACSVMFPRGHTRVPCCGGHQQRGQQPRQHGQVERGRGVRRHGNAARQHPQRRMRRVGQRLHVREAQPGDVEPDRLPGDPVRRQQCGGPGGAQHQDPARAHPGGTARQGQPHPPPPPPGRPRGIAPPQPPACPGGGSPWPLRRIASRGRATAEGSAWSGMEGPDPRTRGENDGRWTATWQVGRRARPACRANMGWTSLEERPTSRKLCVSLTRGAGPLRRAAALWG